MRLWRWAIGALVVLLVIGLMAFARGREHRRGDDVGALGSPVIVLTAVT